MTAIPHADALDFLPTQTRSGTKTRAPKHEPHFDVSLAGGGVAIVLWMALFTGFLYSWFTLGG